MKDDPRKVPVADALRAVIENIIETESLKGLVSLADVVADALADNQPTDIKAYRTLLDVVMTAGQQVHEGQNAARLQRLKWLDGE